MAHIKPIFYIDLILFLVAFLLQTNSALAQKTSPFQGPIFIPAIESHLSIGLPKLIKELTEHYPFEVPYLSKTLGIPFVVITGPVWMPFHKGDAAVNLIDGIRIEKVSRYMNKRMNSVEADFQVKGSCITNQSITEQLGELTLIKLPGNPFSFTNPAYIPDFIYARKIDRGIVTISFSEKNLCLTRFEFHSQLSAREQKKLEEADMRTPEEIQKKG